VFVLSPEGGAGNQFDALAELMTDDKQNIATAAVIIAAPHLKKKATACLREGRTV